MSVHSKGLKRSTSEDTSLSISKLNFWNITLPFDSKPKFADFGHNYGKQHIKLIPNSIIKYLE